MPARPRTLGSAGHSTDHRTMKRIALAPLVLARVVPVSMGIVRIVTVVMRVIRLEGPPGVAIQMCEPA